MRKGLEFELACQGEVHTVGKRAAKVVRAAPETYLANRSPSIKRGFQSNPIIHGTKRIFRSKQLRLICRVGNE